MKKIILSILFLSSVSVYGQQNNTTELIFNDTTNNDTSKIVYEYSEFIKEQLNVVSTWDTDKQKWFYDNFTYPNNIKIPKEKIRPYQPKN
jgi:hypothetical protein